MNNLIDNRQIRVFISSTFQDMQDERDYLMKHTFPILRKLASERDVTLTELDLRWGITEEEAKTGQVVEICLREIENSIPFFIGIIGNRYGWVPEKKDISENVTDRFKDVNTYLERRLSVTEMEMQFGVLQREEVMHAYFYIKEGEEKENADNPEMLECLKKEVRTSRYPSSTYSSPEDLGVQVQQAFTALLDHLFPEGHLSPLEKERVGQRSFMNQLCQNYIRDDKNFKVLDEWLADWEQQQLVVTGASGLGKSALIANWLKEKLLDKHRDYNIIYHFTGNGGSESSHEHIMKVLSDEINDVYGWEAEEEEESNKSQKDKLNDLFIKVASEGKKAMLIVLDAINQIIDTDNAKLLNWFPIPPRNIKILFSTLEDDRTMEVFNNRNYPVFVLQPISLEHRRQLITAYLGWFSKKLTDEQVERIANDRLCENTLLLKTLLDELINFGVYEKLDDRIDYYLSQDTIDEFYQSLLKRFEEDFGEGFVKHILTLIVVSRNSLTEDEIISIIKCTPIHWSQFYCAFSTHLITKKGLIYYAHRYVQDAITERYTNDNDFARSCRKEILSVVSDNNTIRYLEEQTYQLSQLEEYEKLYDLLLNPKTFNTYYKVHPYELGKYWRQLSALGFSILDYLKIEDDSIKSKSAFYSKVSNFSREITADYKSAMSFAKRALEEGGKTQGMECPGTASSYNDIGLVYRDKGDFDKALEYYLKALEIIKKPQCVDNRNTATSYNNIGHVYFNKGDFDKALEYHMKALEIRERILGVYHTATAGSYNNIGIAFSNKGDFDKALEYHMKALEIREKVLGKHPDTAISYNNIGIVYKAKGAFDKALENHMKALQIWKEAIGIEHPNTASSIDNVGTVFRAKGAFDKALEYHMMALQIREEVLNVHHPDTATSYYNIGIVYRDKGDFDKALEYHMKALEIREKALGVFHTATADSYNSVGILYANKGDNDKALELFLKALEIREVTLGVNHPDTAYSFNNIGSMYSDKGDFDKALEYYMKALEIIEKTLGEKHPDTACSYKNIGSVYSDKGDFDKALEYHVKALEIRERILGVYHTATADSYNSVGVLYANKGDYDKALELFLKALEIREVTLGVNHPDTAGSYHNVGNLYGVKGDSGKALEYYMKALGIYEKVLGQNHPKTAYLQNSIAWSYHLSGKYDKAFPHAENAVKAIPNNVSYIDTLATIYKGLGRYAEALEQFERCLLLKKEQRATEESIHGTEDKISALKAEIEKNTKQS